jgi:hypothetical protein
MPRTIRFHLDENCSKAIAEGLRRRGVDVTTSPDVGLLGATDAEQASHALAAGRVVFTLDRDFLRINAARIAYAGIAYCSIDSRSIGEIIDGLVLIWEVLEPAEMQNHVEFLRADCQRSGGWFSGFWAGDSGPRD